MDFFDFLTMLGGLSLFLFGMTIMGQALERRAGDQLKTLISSLTGSRIKGFLTGCGVTCVIQSSSATTVMVVGFVNSGIMTLKQAISVIMGANVGTTITSWILSLGGIDSTNVFVRLLNPSSFTPILALIGIIFFMFCSSSKKKDTGMILLGFATLMFGMETMSSSVEGLADMKAFRDLFIMFKNPILGLLAGAILTAIIQSSSASVGILQALAVTGQVSFGAAIPIIMGQNIGTCITAIISSVGTNKNAKRAAFVHLMFNVIGSIVMMSVFVIVKAIFAPAILDEAATMVGIAICHSSFNIACVIILMPMAGLLEKMSLWAIRDTEETEKFETLDERLLTTPALALEQCRKATVDMAKLSVDCIKSGMKIFTAYESSAAQEISRQESQTDRYEDMLGTYLVKLSSQKLNEGDSEEATQLLKAIGDFERIADHGLNVLESAKELRDKGLTISEKALKEYEIMASAVNDILDMTLDAFVNNNVSRAMDIEPLEQVIDGLKEEIRTSHILRMKRGECSTEVGFIWSDLLTDLERVSDHCSNIAGCIIDTSRHNLNIHETLRATRSLSEDFSEKYQMYAEKYKLA